MKPLLDFRSTRYNYADAVDRYMNLSDNIKTIGSSADGGYDIHGITIGESNKPTISIQASIHGNEWQSVNAILAIIEVLHNPSDFPDIESNVRSIVDNYQIKIIPILNPYGYYNGRRESSNIDLNRDYNDFTQIETRLSRDFLNTDDLIQFIDLHTWPLRAGAIGHGGYWYAIDKRHPYYFLYDWQMEVYEMLDLSEKLTFYRYGVSGFGYGTSGDPWASYRYFQVNNPDSLSVIMEASRVQSNQSMVDYLINGTLLQIFMWDSFISDNDTKYMRIAGTSED